MPAERRLKSYDLDGLALDDNKPFDMFKTTFVEPSGCSQNLEQLFSNAIEGSVFLDMMQGAL